MNRLIFIAWLFTGMATSTITLAQSQGSQYGQNRVQYKEFNWRYYSSDNFDIYFYEGGKDNALIAAKFLEKEFERTEKEMDKARNKAKVK